MFISITFDASLILCGSPWSHCSEYSTFLASGRELHFSVSSNKLITQRETSKPENYTQPARLVCINQNFALMTFHLIRDDDTRGL